MDVSPGFMFTRADTGQALFLDAAAVAAVRQAAQEILTAPTSAGEPPDPAGLQELMGLLDDPEDGLAVPPGIGSWIGIIREREGIRRSLREQGRLRVRYRCRVCDLTLLVDPEREARKAAATDAATLSRQGAGLAMTAAAFDDDDPGQAAFLAVVQAVKEGLKEREAKQHGMTRVCTACDSTDFETVGLTAFCPDCRAPRAESLLLTCPDCGYDFRSLAAQDGWQSLAEARRARDVARLGAAAAEFEKGLRDTQRDALAATLTGDEELVAMCRCARPGEFGRYVALLFTSAHLAWVRENWVSETTSGRVRWADVTAVENPGAELKAEFESGLKLIVANGDPEVFNDFRGKGVRFTDLDVTFDGEGVRRLARLLRGEPPEES
ncbi:hypothetical protein ACBR40_28220 [Nonomuraea sp. AD125B]|uniref:hypothetical protein n=1 Tax=Nonomuraea sp. AD125B TaxID=3242897 RepID=UPI003529AEB0